MFDTSGETSYKFRHVLNARVAELVDARDLKSLDRKVVRVRFSSRALTGKIKRVYHKKWQTLFLSQGTEGNPGPCSAFKAGLLQNLFKLGKQHIIAGLIGNIVDVDVADRALLVHDEDGPLGEAFTAQNAVLLRNGAKGVEIAQQRKGNAAKIFCPCCKAGHMVDADAQDLGIESREAVKLGFVGRYLVGSDGGPGKGEKRQYHVFALKPAEPHLSVKMALQTKVRSLLTYLQFHIHLLCMGLCAVRLVLNFWR